MTDPIKSLMRMNFADPMRGAVHDPGSFFVGLKTALSGITLGQTLAAGGTILSAMGSARAGRDQQRASEFQARQLEEQGKAERAAASVEAANEARQKRLVLSRAQAVGAASGGGLDLDLMGDIEEEGTYRTLTALWSGEERAKGRRAQAAASRFEGAQYRRAGLLEGVKTLAGGGASFMERYG